MFNNEIVDLLRKRLPFYTSDGVNKIEISDISVAGSVLTITTAVDHGLVDGQRVNVAGFLTSVDVTSLIFENGFVKGECADEIDTKENEGLFFEIIGADQPEYNQTVQTDGPNFLTKTRNTFQFKPEDAPAVTPATGDIKLIKDRDFGYNGVFTVSNVTPNTFNVALDYVPVGDPVLGSAYVSTRQFIYGAANNDIAQRAQTTSLVQGNENDIVLYVVGGSTRTTRNREGRTDAQNNNTPLTSGQLMEISEFSIYRVEKAQNSASKSAERDNAIAFIAPLYRSILGHEPQTPYARKGGAILPLGNGEVNDSDLRTKSNEYVHRYDFEHVQYIQTDDWIQPKTRAFLDINLKILNQNDTNNLETNIDLDEEPSA